VRELPSHGHAHFHSRQDCRPTRWRDPKSAVLPCDRGTDGYDKVGEYLEAGVRLIWVIDPRHGRAVVHRSLSDVRELGPDGVLDGEDVLPGFRCALRDLLS